MMTGAVIGAAIVFGIVGSVISGKRRSERGRNFFAEMAIITADYDDATNDRKVPWALARGVWRDNPVLGVGAENFGPYAAQSFAVGQTRGTYDENADRL